MWNNRKFRLRKITYVYATYDDGGGIDTVELEDMIVSVDWMKYPTITKYELHTSWIPDWVREEFPDEDEKPITDRQLFNALTPYYLPPELREAKEFLDDDDLPF